MASLTERVTIVEDRIDHLSREMAAVRGDVRSLTDKVDRLDVDLRDFKAIVDRRFESIDARFVTIDLRFDGMDRRFESVENRIGLLDQKLDQRFAWLVGIQVLTLLSVVGTATAILLR